MTPAPRNAIWIDSKTSIACYWCWIVISFFLMKALDMYVWIANKTGRNQFHNKKGGTHVDFV